MPYFRTEVKTRHPLGYLLSSKPRMQRSRMRGSSSDHKPDGNGQSSVSSRFYIRTAQQKDLNSLADILADSFYPGIGLRRWVYPILRLGIYEDLRLRIRSVAANSICLVAIDPTSKHEDKSEYMVGTVEMAVRTSSWPNSLQYPYISNLAVRKATRRLGVAKKLLLTCEQTALDWGFQDIYLHVLENNHQARQLYFKLGYRLHGIETSLGSYLLKQPRKLFLHKHLSPVT